MKTKHGTNQLSSSSIAIVSFFNLHEFSFVCLWRLFMIAKWLTRKKGKRQWMNAMWPIWIVRRIFIASIPHSLESQCELWYCVVVFVVSPGIETNFTLENFFPVLFLSFFIISSEIVKAKTSIIRLWLYSKCAKRREKKKTKPHQTKRKRDALEFMIHVNFVNVSLVFDGFATHSRHSNLCGIPK